MGTRPDSLPTVIAGIPVLPAAVTVVPFRLHKGLILFPGEIGGRCGTFILDTGAQLIMVNETYLKTHVTNGIIDTVVAGDTSPSESPEPFTVATVRVGTLRHQLDATDAGQFQVNALSMSDERFQNFGGLPPILGLWGLPALRAFETIIDYPHQHLIFIALDSVGHRQVPVPAYRPVTTISLLKDTTTGMFKVVANLAGKEDTLLIDTGAPDNTLTPSTEDKIAGHVSPSTETGYTGVNRTTLATMRLAGTSYPALPFAVLDAFGYGFDILGYRFLSQLKVVGFNFRTRQLLVYGNGKSRSVP